MDLTILTKVAALLATVLGAPVDVARVTAEEVASAGGDAQLLAEVLVWEKHESDFGRGLSGPRFDSKAHGVLQIRGRPDLEHDERRSVRVWLGMESAAERWCGGDHAAGLRAISSGLCNRASHLVQQRVAEADAALYWAGVGDSAGAWQ